MQSGVLLLRHGYAPARGEDMKGNVPSCLTRDPVHQSVGKDAAHTSLSHSLHKGVPHLRVGSVIGNLDLVFDLRGRCDDVRFVICRGFVSSGDEEVLLLPSLVGILHISLIVIRDVPAINVLASLVSKPTPAVRDVRTCVEVHSDQVAPARLLEGEKEGVRGVGFSTGSDMAGMVPEVTLENRVVDHGVEMAMSVTIREDHHVQNLNTSPTTKLRQDVVHTDDTFGQRRTTEVQTIMHGSVSTTPDGVLVTPTTLDGFGKEEQVLHVLRHVLATTRG